MLKDLGFYVLIVTGEASEAASLAANYEVERSLERAVVLVESVKFRKKANSSDRKFTF